MGLAGKIYENSVSRTTICLISTLMNGSDEGCPQAKPAIRISEAINQDIPDCDRYRKKVI